MSTKPRNQRNWKPFVVEWLTRLLLLLLIFFCFSHQLLYKRIRCSAEGKLFLFIAFFTLHVDPPHTHCQTILSVFVTTWTRLCWGGCFSLFGQHFLSFGIIQAVVYLKAQIKFPVWCAVETLTPERYRILPTLWENVSLSFLAKIFRS